MLARRRRGRPHDRLLVALHATAAADIRQNRGVLGARRELHVSANNPYAPPRGAVRDVPAEDQELAGRLVRLLAFVLDGIIASVMIYLPAFVVGAATGSFEQSGNQLDADSLTLPIAVGVIGAIAWAWITILLVARHGQTMGKRLLEIRVVRSDGSQASLGRIFWLRNVVNALLGIIPLYSIIDALLIFGVRRQCIHDLIADTIVVRA
ncbi:MAG: RDD family protein [Lysobacterales bacterium]|nr:MAG: RDD family protein [Xanthomonadales bacterium]